MKSRLWLILVLGLIGFYLAGYGVLRWRGRFVVQTCTIVGVGLETIKRTKEVDVRLYGSKVPYAVTANEVIRVAYYAYTPVRWLEAAYWQRR